MQRFSLLLSVIVISLFALTALSFGQEEAPAETAVPPKELKNPIPMSEASAKAGRQAYVRLCVTCHGLDGKGAKDMAERLAAPPSDLTDKTWKYGGTDGELFTIIRNGTDLGMEPFKEQLNEQRTWHVVNYLRTLAPDSKVELEAEEILENPIPYDAEAIRKGRYFYDNHCALCHAPDGTGYTDYLEFLSTPPADFTTGEFKFGGEDGQIFKVIKEGTGSKDMTAFGDRLSDEDIWNVVHYVKRFSR